MSGRGALRVALAGALGVPVLLGAAPAHAATDVELVADASAWSWRRLAPAPLPVSEPSDVPAGALAVAFDGQPGTASKATYLRLALDALPAGTTLSSLSLVVPLDLAASDDPATSPVVACRLAADFPQGEGLDPSVMPEQDCTGAPVATFDEAASALVVDLTSAGTSWLSGVANTGIVLRPPVDVAAPDVLPYQLVLGGATTVVGRASVTLPVSTPVAPVEPAPLPPVEAFQPDVAAPPVLPGVVLPPPAPAPVEAPQAAPSAAPVPQAVAPVVVRRPLAAVGASASGLAVALLGGLLLLAVAAWSLGDTTGLRAFARAERVRRDRLRHGALVVPAVLPAQPARMHTRQGRRPLSSAASTLT